MALTKTDITETIADKLNRSPLESKEITEELLEILKSTLASGEDVMISGFGKFQVTEKKVRKGRNPATGKAMMLSARRVVTFKVAGKLKDIVNSV